MVITTKAIFINFILIAFILLLQLATSLKMSKGFEIMSKCKVFSGSLIRFSHMSVETKTKMTCSVYLPSITEAEVPKNVPILMYLSGLTCSDENVCQKSGIFKTLSELQVSNHIMHSLRSMVTFKRLLFFLIPMK